MSNAIATRPDSTEYAPYYETYIKLVPEGDILDTLTRQRDATLQLLAGISGERASHRYAPGKWSIKEVVGHLIDTERIFAYRALRFARNDGAALSGFEQDDYVRYANFGDRALGDLAAEFQHVRSANLLFFGGLDGKMMRRRGVANGVEFSVRSIAYILAGHERHHTTIIREWYL